MNAMRTISGSLFQERLQCRRAFQPSELIQPLRRLEYGIFLECSDDKVSEVSKAAVAQPPAYLLHVKLVVAHSDLDFSGIIISGCDCGDA